MLGERPVDFDYGFRMGCGACGGATAIDAETYFREERLQALVPCAHCDEMVHFGPAVALLRDPADPVLDDETVPALAWYHTSTWPDWPSLKHRAYTEAWLRGIADRFAGDVESVIEQAATKALHLGTYEAAIENMIRRMKNQSDERAQFYLYRVKLRRDSLRIEPGHRDENVEEAAALTTGQLDDLGVDVVRYLNVHEAVGLLSLAVRPAAIEAVQQMSLPLDDLASAPSAERAERLTAWEAKRAEIEEAAAPLAGVPAHELRMMQFKLRPDPTGLGALAGEIESRRHSLWDAVDAALVEQYLVDLSPVVAEQFLDALQAWRRRGGADADSVTEYANRVASLATLLARPQQVIERISRQAGFARRAG